MGNIHDWKLTNKWDLNGKYTRIWYDMWCGCVWTWGIQVYRNLHVLCTFWLGNVFRATTACTFSTSQLPKVVRAWCALYVLTWRCASRHKGVHFFDITTSKSGPMWLCFAHFDLGMCFAPQRRATFISHLTTCLRTRRFSKPTFRPSGTTNHWKNTVFRDLATFSRTCIFCLLTLSLSWSSFFFPSLLWLFPPLLLISPYCRKFDF